MSRALALVSAFAAALAAAVAAPRAAHADPHPDVLAAIGLVGRWTEAQNKRRFDDYAALYADDFEGVKRTAKGAETRLALAAWKADRKKMFAGKSLSVEVYGEEYGREKDGSIGVMFRQIFRSGSYGDQGFKILQLKKGADGKLRIAREEIDDVRPLDAATAELSPGKSRVDAAFPKDFASEIYGDGGSCKNEQCAARLLVKSAGGEKAVPLGTWTNNPEGESTGDYRAALRAFSLVPFGSLKALRPVLVVLENTLQNKTADVVARRATLVTAAPDYRVLWSGDLFTAAAAKGGKNTSCRAALYAAAADNKPELLHLCDGGAPKTTRLAP